MEQNPTHGSGPAPQGDGAPGQIEEVSPEMIEAGATVVESRSETATHEELASLVYIAMAAVRSEQARVEND